MDRFALLRRAAEFFKLNPNGWTRSQLARDANDVPVHPSDPRAVCWCAVGRLAKELNVPVSAGESGAYRQVSEALGLTGTGAITGKNDSAANANEIVAFLAQDFPQRIGA